MYAKSTQEGQTATHIPLQSRQTPQLATRAFIAQGTIKQFQPVFINLADNKVEVATNVTATGNPIGVAAFGAQNGESVSVYLQGFFNVDALDVSGIAAIASGTSEEKAKHLNLRGTAGIYFDAFVGENPVNHV